jgi:hypothetical protein
MYQSKWNHASRVKTNCATHKPLLVHKKVLNYTITMKLATNKAEARQCQWPGKCLKCPMEAQILKWLFQHFIDLWVASYMVYHTNNILGNTLHIL